MFLNLSRETQRIYPKEEDRKRGNWEGGGTTTDGEEARKEDTREEESHSQEEGHQEKRPRS